MAPENAENIFNHRHSFLRKVIERTSSVLKKQFPIISRTIELFFVVVDIVIEIILSCCILYNCLVGVDLDKKLIVEVDRELSNNDILNESRISKKTFIDENVWSLNVFLAKNTIQ